MKRIFIPKKTVVEIEGFISTLRKKSVDFHKKVVREKDPKKETDNWDEIDTYINTEATKLFGMLEDNFRNLLGHYSTEVT